MFNSLRLTDFNATTIEIDTNELQKDNHLVEFYRLEDILNFCNPRNTILVQLKKGLRGLGIALCGGKQTKIESLAGENFALINQLIRVKKLYPAHPASECGLIDENDFILDVNDQCFVGLTYIVSMCAFCVPYRFFTTSPENSYRHFNLHLAHSGIRFELLNFA